MKANFVDRILMNFPSQWSGDVDHIMRQCHALLKENSGAKLLVQYKLYPSTLLGIVDESGVRHKNMHMMGPSKASLLDAAIKTGFKVESSENFACDRFSTWESFKEWAEKVTTKSVQFSEVHLSALKHDYETKKYHTEVVRLVLEKL
jgi:hypothetical protein